MPNRNEILNEISNLKNNAQDIIRRNYLKKLSEFTGRDTILYATSFTTPKLINIPNTSLAITDQDIGGFMASLNGLKNNKLDILLHNPGGSPDATEQIVNYLRSKYENIRVIIPQNAMSAATMLACAADTIVMGKHSAIGPIDPQLIFPRRDGILHTTSAQSILDEFATAKKEVNEDNATIPLWITKIENYPPGFLTQCQTAIDSSIQRVRNWLKLYMLKDNPDKADEISEWLGSEKDHKAHGKPITRDLAKQKGLTITDLEDDQKLQDLVLSIFHATSITFEITPCVKIIENHNGVGMYNLFVPG